MIKRLKMLAALLLVITASQAANHRLTLQEWRADTLKTDTLAKDTLQADSVKQHKPKKKGGKDEKKKEEKKETEYEKLMKKGGTELKGLFTVRHIEDKYYFEVPDSMLGRLLLCVTRFTAVPQGFGQFPGEEITHNTVYFEKRDTAKLLMRQYVLSYLADDKDNISRTLVKSTIDPIVESFKIIGCNEKKDAQLVEVTPLFKQDNQLFSFQTAAKTSLKLGGLQGDRTFVDTMKVFPAPDGTCSNTLLQRLKALSSTSSISCW